MRGWNVVAMVVGGVAVYVACAADGGTRSGGGPGAGTTVRDAAAADADVLPTSVAGTRLRPATRVITSPDGAMVRVPTGGFFDVERGEACSPERTTEGLRCVPTLRAAPVLHVDAFCIERPSAVTCEGASPYLAQRDGCGAITAVFKVSGPPEWVASQIHQRTGNPGLAGCTTYSGPRGPELVPLEQVELSAFAPLEESVE